MREREETVRLWLDMWLRREDFGIRDIFAPDAVYTESWGPVYHGAAAIEHWFREWLTRGRVLAWDIHRFFHAGEQTAVTWFFQCRMGEEEPVGFEGVSVVNWTEAGRIAALTEYCCEPEQYDPYAGGAGPVLADGGRGLYRQFAGGPAPRREALPSANAVGRCGFCCGVCPSFLSGACAGCDAAHGPGDCFTRDCTARRGLSFCTLCGEFPCGELLEREKATVLDKDWLRWKRQG